MATRCPRCRAHDLELESFGVFRCATCGRVNIDGEPIAEGATEAPALVHTGSASFAAPPATSTPLGPLRPPLPRFLFAMIIIEAVLTVVGALGPGGSLFRLCLRMTLFGGLLTGHRGAYRYALGAMMVSLVLGGIALTMVWPQVNSMARLLLVALVGIDVAFFVALLSTDARNHFDMQRAV